MKALVQNFQSLRLSEVSCGIISNRAAGEANDQTWCSSSFAV